MANRAGTTSHDALPTRGRRRNAPVQVKKPFPWGTVATAAVLGLFLVAILVYAVVNQGAGFVDPVTAADKKVKGVKIIKLPSSKHVEGKIDYGTSQPPAGGDMNNGSVQCQVYTAPVVTELAVHSLEHGGVWVSYRPDLPKADLAKLTGAFGGQRNVLVSPFTGQTAPVSVQAWGRQLTVSSVSDSRIGQFVDAYKGGAQAPEGTVGC